MLKAGQTIDRYTVDRLLGQGGMAVVYRVTHNQLGSFHALKVLTLTNPAIRERLLQEGRVQASLRHANVVSVTDVIDVEGAPGLVMEYVDGPSLDAWLQTHRPTLEESERLFRGIVAGVSAAHDQGLVHRDLKPANVMLAPASGGAFVPKVADFGLAKALAAEDLGHHKTRSGVTMGTPAYMAPEQIRDAKNVDHRADLFSLGCILYELACGRPPFTGPDILSIFNAVASGSYPPPKSIAPELPQRIQDAIQAALRVDRDARLASCATLLDLLDGRIGGETLVGPVASPATFDPEGIEQALGPALDASLSPPEEPPPPPKRRFRVRWPGRRNKGTASQPPTSLERWFVPLVVAPSIVIGALAAGGMVAWRMMATRWDAAARAALVERTGGEISYGDSWVRPWGVTLDDVVVNGSDGQPLVEVARLRLRGGWGLRKGFEPRDVRVDGAVLYPRRTGDAWVLPDRTLATLRARAAEGRSLAIRRLSTGPLRMEAKSDRGTLKGFAEKIVLTDVILLPAEGKAWTAAGFETGHLTLDAGDPVLSVESSELVDGTLVVQDAECWVRIRPDGVPELPPVVAESVPDWLGGEDHHAHDEEWFGLRTGLWPVDAARVEVRSGELHLYDRAHAPSTQEWEFAIDRFAVGPIAEGWLPVDGAASTGDARFTLEGDVRADGMFRGRLGLRHLPLDRFAPYMDEQMRWYRVEPTGGELGGDVDFTLKGDSVAARYEALAENVEFAPLPQSPGAPLPPDSARALAIPRERVPVHAEVVGSLADPAFHPIDDLILATVDALLAPAVESGPSRPKTRARPTPEPLPRPIVTAPAPAPAPVPPDDPEQERALRTLDEFRREVIDVLDEYSKTGRSEERGNGRGGPP